MNVFSPVSYSRVSISVQFFAAHRPFGQSVQAAINAPTQTVHVTSGARHCACARRAYYAPFPARALGRHLGRVTTDIVRAPDWRLIDRTRFKCYRPLMLIWPVHLNAASKSRIIAGGIARRRTTYRRPA